MKNWPSFIGKWVSIIWALLASKVFEDERDSSCGDVSLGSKQGSIFFLLSFENKSVSIKTSHNIQFISATKPGNVFAYRCNRGIIVVEINRKSIDRLVSQVHGSCENSQPSYL